MAKKICVLGLGYIGLPTAAMFANSGYNVVGVDINQDVIDNLNEGKIIIEEPYLETLVKEVVDKNMLKGSLIPCKADIFIICVPTPITEGKNADLRYVINASNAIIPYLKKGDIVILESTSPVGTTKDIVKSILEKTDLEVGKDIYLGYSPERVLPGQIINELVSNHRVVGGINEISAFKIKEVYESFVEGGIYTTDTNTAEMVKLVENTFRDVNIAFANELAQICDHLDMNVWDVIEYSNKHPRVNILNPGPGVGGHCLAVDPWFIVESSRCLSNMINLARNINDSMPDYVFNKIEKLTENIKGKKKICVLGATYKNDIDDMRESPIIHLIDILREHDYEVSIYDPYIKSYDGLNGNVYDCSKDSDLILIGVDHSVFRQLDYESILQSMRNNIILDTRNKLDCNRMELIGYRYFCIGTKI
ncbi:MAG: nucleotide sugar dehydrogenase [Peptostreptococcaceae bacterium]